MTFRIKFKEKELKIPRLNLVTFHANTDVSILQRREILAKFTRSYFVSRKEGTPGLKLFYLNFTIVGDVLPSFHKEKL